MTTTPPETDQPAEHARSAIHVVTSVNGEQMRATRGVSDGTEGYVNVDTGPGYRFWGDAYVASAEPESERTSSRGTA